MEKQTIGRFISALRKANGYTQAQLAEKLGVSDKAVSRWERDETAPDLTLIPVIAELFGVSCDELLRGQRATPQSTPSAPDPQPQRSKYLRQHLKKSLTNFQIRSSIAMGIGVLGLIAAMICNLVFLRASLGLLTGCVFYGTGMLLQWIFLTMARSTVDEEEFDTDQIRQYRHQLLQITLRTILIILLLLFATLPLSMVGDSHMGLSGYSWFAAGILWLAVGSVLIWAVWAGCKALRGAQKETSKTYQYLKRNAIVMLILLLIYWMIGQFLPDLLMRPIQFDNWDDFKTYMARTDEETFYGSDTVTQALPPSEDVIFYDEQGNEITEEEFYTETITDKEGNVLCTYLHKNSNVWKISYDLPTENSSLNISIYTQSELNRAAFVVKEIQELFLILFPVTFGLLAAFTFRKKSI